MKTDHSTTGLDGNTNHGALFGVDLYGRDRVWEVACGYPAATNFNTVNYSAYDYVPYNTPDWTQKTLDFIVPSKTFTTNSEGGSIPSQQISDMIPWIYMGNHDAGSGWFADAELYINP